MASQKDNVDAAVLGAAGFGGVGRDGVVFGVACCGDVGGIEMAVFEQDASDVQERAAESSQLVTNCAVWMGMSSVWPSIRMGLEGSSAARLVSIGMDAVRISAEPEGKNPTSCSEMTRPSGVVRSVTLPGGIWLGGEFGGVVVQPSGDGFEHAGGQ